MGAEPDGKRDLTPRRTGYLHLPPLWVVGTTEEARDHLVHGDDKLSGNADDVVCTRLITEGVTGTFRRDGLTLFEFTKSPFVHDRDPSVLFSRITLANAHLACLYGSVLDIDNHGLERMTVTHMNAAHQRDDEYGTVYADIHTKALMKHDGYTVLGFASGSVVHVAVTWVPTRHLLSAAAVEESFVRLASLAEGGLARLGRYELLVRASVAAQVHDFASTVILSWGLIENAVTDLWHMAVRDLAADRGGSPEVDRYKRLTAETKVNLLRTVGLVPDEVHEELTRVRQARNRWTHRLANVTHEDAELALSAASRAMKAVDQTPWAIRLEPTSGGYSF